MAGFVVDVSAATVCVTIGVAVVGVVVVAFVIAIVVGKILLRIVVVVVVVFVIVVFVFVVVVLGLFLWTLVGGVSFRGIDVCGRSMIDGSFRHYPVEVDVWHEVRVADSAEIG